MKKRWERLLATLLLAVLATALLSGAALADTVRGATGKSYIRTEPSLSGRILGTLPQGATASYRAQATDERGVTWYKISYDGMTGWVSSMYTSYEGTDAYNAIHGNVYSAAGDFADIYDAPSVYGDMIAVFPDGERANFLGETWLDGRGVRWYKVTYGTVTGWVSGNDVSYRGAKLLNFSNDAVYASASRVYLRSEPSAGARSVGWLDRGERAVFLGATMEDEDGAVWYQLGSGNISGWAIADGISGKAPGFQWNTGMTVTGVTGKSYIRKSPNLSGKILGTLPIGGVADYLGNTSYDERGVAWYNISYDGMTGWVSSKYTSLE